MVVGFFSLSKLFNSIVMVSISSSIYSFDQSIAKKILCIQSIIRTLLHMGLVMQQKKTREIHYFIYIHIIHVSICNGKEQERIKTNNICPCQFVFEELLMNCIFQVPRVTTTTTIKGKSFIKLCIRFEIIIVFDFFSFCTHLW